MSSCSIIPVSQLASIGISESDYIVFGGTFDPFHEGHLSAIRAVMPYFKKIIIAPTEQNPWKEDLPISVRLRAEMARMVLESEKLPLVNSLGRDGIFVTEDKYNYSEEMVKNLRALMPGRLLWLIGEDSKNSVQYWRNWSELDVTTIVAPVIINVHAEYIRTGKIQLHPALVDFAKQNGLYGF